MVQRHNVCYGILLYAYYTQATTIQTVTRDWKRERAQVTDSTVQVHFGIGEGESRGEREAQLVGGMEE